MNSQCEISTSSKNRDLDSDAIQRASAEVEAADNQHDAAIGSSLYPQCYLGQCHLRNG